MIGAIETIGIFSPDGRLLINAPVTDNCERNETLMGDEYVSLSFNHEAGAGIPAFSYIEYDGRFYFCKDDYHPQNAGGYYKYEARFVSASNMLDKFVFMRYVSVGTETWREAEFSINANILTIGTIIVQSIREAVRRLPDCKFKSFLSAIDLPAGNSYGDTKLQALSFSGTDIRSAITTVANTWETECWIEETGTAAYLHFDKCETGDLLTLSDEYVETDGVWKSGGLTECSYASNKNTPVQRIIPYGSERNIIRKVAQQTVAGNVMNVSYAKRLKLDPDTTYNVSYDGEAAQVTTDGDGAFSLPGVNTGVESVEFFDDVYPRETFVVDSVAQKGNQNYPYYTITAHASSGVEPSLPVEIAEGLTLSIIFESGYLNGFEFEVRDDSKQGGVLTLTIIPQTDGDDVQVPIGSFVPKEGDTFAMFNMIMPESYVTAAKQELAQEAYVKLCEVRDTMPELNCQSEPSYFVDNGVNLKVGTRISVDSNLFGGKPYVSRVISYSHSLTTPDTVTFKLCSSRVLGALAAMNNAIADQTNSMDGLYQNSISLSRRGWRDAKELADMLESLAAEMLLVGNEKWQFAISCTISMKNSSGKFSGLQITAGMLQHTQPPYTERENKGVWQMPAATYSTTVISDPDTPYYLYADVSGETSGTWLISADKKDDENHLLVGTISSEFEGQRVFNRTYGYTAITGGKITTEQIQDANRNLIIDFSSNPPRILARNGAEIIGNIKFKSTSGEYKGIEEGIAESIDGIETGTRNLILDSLCDKKIPSLATTGGYTTGGLSNMTVEISDEVLYNGKPTLKIQNKPDYYSNQLYIQFDRYNRTDTKLDVADYVFSCMMYVPETYPDKFPFENKVGLFCYNGSTESGNDSYVHADYDPSKKGTWQKLVAKVPYVKPADGATDWCFFRIRSANSTTQGTGDPSLCCLYIAEIQLVKGNQAGTWTPAPEDAQAELQAAIEEAETAANNAQAAINSLNSDNIFSVVEKKSIRVEWESISGRADTTHDATVAGDGTFMKTVNTAAGVMSITGSEDIFKKYDALKTQLNTYKLYTNSDTTLAANFKTVMAGKFADYYDAEVKLMQAVQELYTNKSIDEIEIGGTNICTGSSTLTIGTGRWKKGNWRNSISNGTMENIDIEEPPMQGIKGGIRFTTTGQIGVCQDKDDGLNDGAIVTMSCWVRSNNACTVVLQPYYNSNNSTNVNKSFSVPGNNIWTYLTWSNPRKYAGSGYAGIAYVYIMTANCIVDVCGIKLEQGNKPTAWSPAPEDVEAKVSELDYLKEALQGTTDINGGLLLTTLIQLRNAANAVTAGMSGLDGEGQNVFLWCGGTLDNAIKENVLSLIRRDGSGFFAGKKMKWGTDGSFQVGPFEVTSESIIINGENRKIVITSRSTDNLIEYDNAEYINIDSSTQLKEITTGSGEYTGSVSIGTKSFSFAVNAQHYVFAPIQITIYGATFVKDAQTKPKSTTINFESIKIIAKSNDQQVYSSGNITINKNITIKAQERNVGTGNATIYTPGYGSVEGYITIPLYANGNLDFEVYPTFSYSISSDGGGYIRLYLSISSSEVYTTEKNMIIANNGLLIRSSGKSYIKIENSETNLHVEMKGLPKSAQSTQGILYVEDGFLKIS